MGKVRSSSLCGYHTDPANVVAGKDTAMSSPKAQWWCFHDHDQEGANWTAGSLNLFEMSSKVLMCPYKQGGEVEE